MTATLHPLVPGDHPERDEELERARAEVAELQEALRSSRTIGTAIGIIMERYQLDAEAAVGFLKRVSSEQNRKLRDLAAGLVETRHLPTNDA